MLGIIWFIAKVIVLGFIIYVVGMIILYEIVEYFGRAYNRANMLRQMQYRRLSYRRCWNMDGGRSVIIMNNPATFRFMDSPVIINETSTPSISDWLDERIQFYNEIRELCSPNDLADMPRQITEISTELAQQEWRDFEDHRVRTMNPIVQRLLQNQSESDVSEAAAKGEIKPRGKSVSVDEVIAKIDEHLKKGGSV